MPPEKLSGTIQNDILKEFMVRNTYIYPPAALDAHRLRHLRLHVRRTCRSSTRSRSPAITCRRRARRRISSSPTRWPTASSMSAPASPRARHRRVRAAAVVLLGDRHELLHGGRQAARRAPALGEAREGVRAQESAKSLALRTHCQTSRLVAHRAGRVQQRRAHLHRGDGGDAGRHAVAAHQRARRGARAADRFLGPHRAQHPALPAAGDRHDADHRPVGRLLLRRARSPTTGADARWSHIAGGRELGGMAKAIEAGIPKLRIEEAAARTQARIDSRRADDRRRQQVPARGRSGDRGAARSTTRAVRATADREARPPARPSATEAEVEAALDGADAKRRATAPATCWRSPSRRRGRRRRSARSPRRWKRSAAATGPRSAPISGVYKRRDGQATYGAGAHPSARRRLRARTTAAGRASSSPRWARTATTAARRSSPRPSPISASTSISARCSRRPAEAARAGGRERRPHRRRLLARRRPPDARAGAEGGAREAGPPGHHRSSSAASSRRGITPPSTRPARRDLPPGHHDRGGGGRSPRQAQRASRLLGEKKAAEYEGRPRR